MDIKLNTFDNQIWGKKHLFLDISSNNIGALVSSLHQCVETHSIEAFRLSQPLPQFRFIICDIRTSLRGFLHPVVNYFSDKHFPP
jgi:hypothetical protein